MRKQIKYAFCGTLEELAEHPGKIENFIEIPEARFFYKDYGNDSVAICLICSKEWRNWITGKTEEMSR